jgi:hypothetical protein
MDGNFWRERDTNVINVYNNGTLLHIYAQGTGNTPIRACKGMGFFSTFSSMMSVSVSKTFRNENNKPNSDVIHILKVSF